MKTETASDRVQKVGIFHRDGDDVRDVELEEVDVCENRVLVRVSDDDENQKGYAEEVEDAGGVGSVAARVGRCHD